MPSLPRYESQVAAQANRRVIDQPTFAPDTAVGDALQRAGKAGFELAARVQQARVDAELVAANRLARERLEKAKHELEQNREIKDEEIEPTLRKQGDDIIAEVGEGITATSARKVWSENAKTLQSDGDIWARKTAMARGVDRVKAGHVTAAAALEAQAGDLSISPEAYAKSLQDEKGAILRNKDRGILSEETAAEQLARLEKLAVKDRTERWLSGVTAMSEAGQFDAAAELLKGAARDYGQAAADDARAIIQREKTRQEAELSKRQTLNANQFEIDVLDGKAGRMQLNEAVEREDISVNQVPALIRAIGYEEERRAAEDGLSAAEKAALADWSLDALQMLDTASQLYLTPMDQWPANARHLYDGMDAGRKRAVRQRMIDAGEKGRTQDSTMAVYRDLVARAKPLVPQDWKLSSDTAFGEGDGLTFSGQLYEYAKRHAQETGGKPIVEKDAREIVARALNAFKPYKPGGLLNPGPAKEGKVNAGYVLPPDIRDGDYYDRRFSPTGNEIWKAMQTKLRRDPTKDEFMAAYAQVTQGR